MKCFICGRHFNSTKILISHLRHKHSYDDGAIHCPKEGCLRHFSNVNSFRKHFKQKHSNPNPGMSSKLCNDKTFHQSEIPESENKLLTQEKFNSVPSQRASVPTSINTEERMFDPCGFKKAIATFVSQLYANDSIPRSAVHTIISRLADIFNSDTVQKFYSFILLLLKKLQCITSLVDEINECFNILKEPFFELSSEYKRFKYFEESGFYIKPHEVCFGEDTIKKVVNNNPIIEYKQSKSSFIPLRQTLKKVFELPNVYKMTQEYIKLLQEEQNATENFIQSTLWQSKKIYFTNKTVFPIFIYYDDYDTGNVLGSHSGTNKLGAIYASIPCFPPQCTSQIKNIFLVQLFKSSDRKKYGNKVFSSLIDELNYLSQNGILITLQNSTVETVYFALGLCIGDNLGLNSMLGFVESFSSGFFCRLCKMSKNDSKRQLTENTDLLRNVDNYKQDLLLQDYSLTGIKEECVFNNVIGFHVTENYCVDIMHDLLEGVCSYDMSLILNNFISDVNLFSLNTLNAKIEAFDYGSFTNIPPKITAQALKKSCIKMSASEMLCFMFHVSLMIGHLVPKENKHWDLFINLIKILNIVLDKTTIPENKNLLKSLVSEHHYIYCVCLKQELKPKHHNMTHYPRILSEVGPLVHTWSMRFEAKHRPSKITANVSCSKKNLCYTLAVKNQLHMCYRLISANGFETSKTELGHIKFTDINCYEHAEYIPDNGIDYVQSVKWVKIQNVTLKKSTVVLLKVDQLPRFGRILDIIAFKDDLIVIYEEFSTISFDEHLQAFQVQCFNKKVAVKIENLSCSLVIYNIVTSADGNNYVVKYVGL